MEMFSANGHLTDEGLDAVIEGRLDELQALEASEHLSFCDGCLLRYTDRLEHCEMMSPLEDVAPVVIKRVKSRKVKQLFRRYGTVAAAMAFAMTLWSVGAFTNLIPVASATDSADAPIRQQTVLNKAGDFVAAVGDKIAVTLNGVFGLDQKATDSMSSYDKAKVSAEEIRMKNAAKKAEEEKKIAKAKADKAAADKAAAKEAKAQTDKAAAEKAKADKADADEAKAKADKAALDKVAEDKKRTLQDDTGDKAIASLRDKSNILETLKNTILAQ